MVFLHSKIMSGPARLPPRSYDIPVGAHLPSNRRTSRTSGISSTIFSSPQ